MWNTIFLYYFNAIMINIIYITNIIYMLISKFYKLFLMKIFYKLSEENQFLFNFIGINLYYI